MHIECIIDNDSKSLTGGGVVVPKTLPCQGY